MAVPYKLAVLVAKLKDADCGPIRQQGPELRCRCPAHADNGPSLYIAVTEDKVLVRCSAGCTLEAVCERLDHDLADLFFTPDESWVEVDAELGVIATEAVPNEDAAKTGPPGAEPVLADEELRHGVYSALLDQLELSTAHFDDLRRRGLPPLEIVNRGYKSIDSGRIRKAVDALLEKYGRDKLLTVPGFQEKDDRVFFLAARGYLIPVRAPNGCIIALKVRHDADYNGPKYTWVSSKGASCGNPVHVPRNIKSPVQTVRLTEGELKSDITTFLSQVPTISVPGVTNWQLAIPILKELGAQKVLLAFDQDGKPGTITAMQKALLALTRERLEVMLEWWDGKVGKGIDDLLAAGAQPELIGGLAAIVRVQDLLSAPEPERPDLPESEPEPFPVDVLPPALAAYCEEVAEATATPPDFAGVVMLATAGAAIGNSRAICLKENIWYESPRIYAANVGDPASGKSPAMDAVIKPYQALQLRLINDYKADKAEYDKAVANNEQTVKENRASPESDRRPLPTVPDEPQRPERFVVMDATVESLGPLLEENPRGLLMPQDEGVGWVRGMGQYKGGRGNDRQFWLSNWSGKSHIVDRKSQGSVPICIPRPFVNVVCGIPPDMLNELADYQGRNDGFLHRILFVFPKPSTGTDWTDITVTKQSKEAWEMTLTGLRKLAMQELEDGVLGYRVVRFTPAARQAWIDWWNAHAAEMRSEELPIQLIGPWGKLKAYTARFALVLHYLWLVQTEEDEGDLDEISVQRAVRLISYFKAHLRLVYGRLRQTPEDNHLLEVLDWIRKKGGQCTARDLANAKKVSPTDKAKKVLKELEERGYGRIEWREAKNGKKVAWFVFDPT